MIEVELERLETSIKGAKRQHAPFAIRWACPGCATAHVDDLTTFYLSYPTFGALHEYTLYCAECEQETPLWLRLDMTLSMAVPSQPPEEAIERLQNQSSDEREPILMQDRAQHYALLAREVLGPKAALEDLLACAMRLCKGSERPEAVMRWLEKEQ